VVVEVLVGVVFVMLLVALREIQWRERLGGAQDQTAQASGRARVAEERRVESEVMFVRERESWGQERRRLEARFDTRVNELIRQNQNLVERIASLRAEGGLPAGGEEQHLDGEPEVEPFSQALDGFLSKIENSDARQQVEEQVHYMRDVQHMSDEQVLEELRR
jgi:hypothetical protein